MRALIVHRAPSSRLHVRFPLPRRGGWRPWLTQVCGRHADARCELDPDGHTYWSINACYLPNLLVAAAEEFDAVGVVAADADTPCCRRPAKGRAA